MQLDRSSNSYELGPLVLDAVRLHAAVAAVVIAALLWLFFTCTRTGKAIRAAADNHMGALVVGLDVRRLYAVTFGVGAACVGAAGALMITIIPVTPFLAAEYTLLAFVIVIVGGLGSMTGALMGGLLIGVSEARGGPAAAALAQEHVQLRAADPGAAAAAAGPVRQAAAHERASSASSATPRRASCGASASCSRCCWWRRCRSASTGSRS